MSARNALEAWLTAARRQRYDVTPRTHEASFARISSRLQRPWRAFALAAALSALAIGIFIARQPSPITYSVQRWDGEREVRTLDFSDGTNVELTHGSALEVAALSTRGAVLRLRTGHASLSVTPRKAASWVVQAGPYRVRVTGTAFEVDWSEATQRFEIAMRHGSVVVSGPQLADVALRAGERLVAGPPRPEAAPVVAEAAEPTAAVERPRRVVRDWSSRIANGEFEAVLREAEQAGLRSTFKHAKLDDLVALADAARYARRSELAQRALLAMRRRFPSAPASHDAAFLLGRIAEGDAALRWYQRYLDERPEGRYTAEALGRVMMVMHDRADRAGAASYAARYLQREPQGPYAQAARNIVAAGP
jgi:hypothetical protein